MAKPAVLPVTLPVTLTLPLVTLPPAVIWPAVVILPPDTLAAEVIVLVAEIRPAVVILPPVTLAVDVSVTAEIFSRAMLPTDPSKVLRSVLAMPSVPFTNPMIDP